MVEKVIEWAEDHWSVLAAFGTLLFGFGRWNMKLRDDVIEHTRRLGEIEEDTGKRDVTGLWVEVREHSDRLNRIEHRCEEHGHTFDVLFQKIDDMTKALHELIGEVRAWRKGN